MPGTDFSELFAERLYAFLDDPRIKGRVTIVSGSRTYAEQKWLYELFLSGQGNLAANPDRTIGRCHWADPPFTARGSWHMVQPGPGAGGAGAADLGWANIETSTMHAIADGYGLRFPVGGEPWHVQAYTSLRVYPRPQPPGDRTVSTIYGNASYTPVYIDETVIVLWHDLGSGTDHNFHVLNRATGANISYRHGKATDTFADVRRRGADLDLTVRRGGNEYHTLIVDLP